MVKQLTRLCVKTRRGRTHVWGKKDVARAATDALFYVDAATDERSEYWYGCDVWLEVADVSPWRRVDLSGGA